MLALLLHAGFAFLLLSADNVGGLFVVIAVGAIALGGAVALLTRQTAMVAAIVLGAFVGTFASAYLLDSLRDLEVQLDHVRRQVPPSGFADAEAGTVVTLRDATLRSDLVGGSIVERRRGGTEQVRVAPIVPPGWTPADPVPAWAGFRTSDSWIGGSTEADGLAAWAVAANAGFVVAHDRFYDAAIANAEERHHLRAVASAPILWWRDPDAEHTSRVRNLAIALLATQGLWLLSTINLWRARREAPPRTPRAKLLAPPRRAGARRGARPPKRGA